VVTTPQSTPVVTATAASDTTVTPTEAATATGGATSEPATATNADGPGFGAPLAVLVVALTLSLLARAAD